MDSHTTPELRSARDVCAQLGGISDVTLWRHINSDTLNFPKPIKINRRNYFRANEVDAWIENMASTN